MLTLVEEKMAKRGDAYGNIDRHRKGNERVTE
jgi:hypothetical protein